MFLQVDTAAWSLLPLLLSLGAIAMDFTTKIGIISVILVRGRGRASSRLTWIVVILAVPLLGFLLYLLVGEIRLGRRRTSRHRLIVDRVENAMLRHTSRASAAPAILPEAYRQLALLGETVGHNRAKSGNELELIGDTDQFIDALVRDIDVAELHCHLLFYIYLADGSGPRVADALMRAAARGVECRVLIDAVGSKSLARSNLRRAMERAGVRVVESLPARALRMLFARVDLRNHRKLVVIDGCIGYVGSQNVADADFAPKPRFAPWIDTMVRVAGPAVHDLQILFVEDWFLDTDESLEELLTIHPLPCCDGMPVQIMGTGPGPDGEAMRKLFHTAINLAREEVIVTTPYFVPDDATATAIRTAARRGVETLIVVPARNDSPLVAAASRGLYESLLAAGVTIYEFQGGLLHAKTLTLDRNVAMVGSAESGPAQLRAQLRDEHDGVRQRFRKPAARPAAFVHRAIPPGQRRVMEPPAMAPASRAECSDHLESASLNRGSNAASGMVSCTPSGPPVVPLPHR